MAAIVITSVSRPGYCARLEQFGRAELLRIGLDGTGLQPNATEVALGITAGEIASQALQLALDGYVSIVQNGTADTNTSSPTYDYTARGVTTPDATTRVIETFCYIADNDGQGIVHGTAQVDGGSTPIVVTDSADADPLVSGLGGTPTAVISVSTANVILTTVGISAVPTRWIIEHRIFPAQRLAYNP